jgi:SAM-dependent MidA family methyltransferase
VSQNPLEEILRDEIRRGGPMPFRRFMEAALYHPEYGYYRRPRDPFGAAGDFFTAEQVQPVFGILVAAQIRRWYEEAGSPAGFTVVELGAGRREMAPAFAPWRYVPVDIDGGALPERFRGVVFSNEFFDALPVEAAVWSGGAYREMRVGLEDGRFAWVCGGEAPLEVSDYLARYFPPPEEGRLYEANLAALAWLERIAAALESGWIFTIDYGYTRAEWLRFPRGTLMSYRRHTAREQVLENPGAQDITAHVAFTALQEHGAAHGLATLRFENLARTLLNAGEPDHFAAALAGLSPQAEMERKLQLKTLLFGMGETFRTLIQRKAAR